MQVLATNGHPAVELGWVCALGACSPRNGCGLGGGGTPVLGTVPGNPVERGSVAATSPAEAEDSGSLTPSTSACGVPGSAARPPRVSG